MRKSIFLMLITGIFLNIFMQNVSATASLSVVFTPSATVTYPTTVEIKCSNTTIANHDSITLIIYRNGSEISRTRNQNPVLVYELLPYGAYNYSCAIFSPYNNGTEETFSINNNVNVLKPYPADSYYIEIPAEPFLNDTGTGKGGGTYGAATSLTLPTDSAGYKRVYQRWNLTTFSNITNIYDARIFLYRDTKQDSYLASTNQSLYAYAVNDSAVSDAWNEYTLTSEQELCGELMLNGVFNGSCSSIEMSIATVKGWSASTNSYFILPIYSFGVSDSANNSYFNTPSKQFTTVITNLADENLGNNYRNFIATKENTSLAPKLILLYSTGVPSLSLTFSPAAPVYYPTQTIASCSKVTGDPNAMLVLYRNESVVAFGQANIISDPATLNAGIYNYSCEYVASANYTSQWTTDNYLTINKGTPSISLTASPSFCTPTGNQSTVACSRVTGGSEQNIALFRNRGYANYTQPSEFFTYSSTSPVLDIQTFAAGNYTYFCVIVGNDNWDTTSTSDILTVNSTCIGYPPITPIPVNFSRDIVNFLFVDNYGLNGMATILNLMVSSVLFVFVNKKIKPEYALRAWLICFGIIAFVCSIYVYPAWLGVSVVIIEITLIAWLFVKFGKGLIGM